MTGMTPEITRDISSLDHPIEGMMDMLRQLGYQNFSRHNSWENCLCTLLVVFEPRCKAYRFLESLPYDQEALEEISTLSTMANLGYSARHVQTKLADLDPRLLPALFIPKNSPPIVVLSPNGRDLSIASGHELAPETMSRLLQSEGTAWTFEKYNEAKSPLSKFMREGTGQSWFRALFGRFHDVIGQIFMSGLLLNIISLFMPILTMLVYDRVIASGTTDTLPMLALGATIALGFEWMLRRVRSQGLSWLATRMDNIVSNKIFSHLILLSSDLLERASVSSQIARIKTFEAIRDFFSSSAFLSMVEMPFVVLSLVVIYAIAGEIVWVPVFSAAVFGLLFYAMRQRVQSTIRLAAKATSAKQQFILETFEKISGVRGYGLGARWQQKYRDLSGREMLAHFRLGFLGMTAETIANAITMLSAVATVTFGIHLIWASHLTTGGLVATMILVWRVLTPFYSLCTMIPRLEQIRNSILQVNKLIDMDVETTMAKATARLTKIQGGISFKDVMCRYENESDPVFNGMNFTANPGDILVITGQNGSGKTSLIKMIKGLYAPAQGSVQIDGFDVRQLDPIDLRRQIAYVPQNADIFSGTIVENLRIANPLASEMDMETALRLADAWDEIQQLPEKLDSVISRHGSRTISVNLASKISLARAYLHPASILLIDELPNSLLNSKTGANLLEYMKRNKGKRTILMVTYREDFSQIADQILLLHRDEVPQSVFAKDFNPTNSVQREVA